MSGDHTAIFDNDVTRIVVAVQQGPAGPPGPAIPAGTPSYVAAAELIAFKVVALADDGRMIHADNTVAAHASAVLGIVLTSPAADEAAAVQRNGEVINTGWSWLPTQTLFLGTNGALVTAPPAAPAVFSLSVGLAVAGNKVIVNIGQPIGI
jgi:hypothetical protein